MHPPQSLDTTAVKLRAGVRIRSWNKRIHLYLGLYFLLFIWLFSISGLLLNNSGWRTAQFWEDRNETTFQQKVRALPVAEETEAVRQILADLGLEGEINGVTMDGGQVSFQVTRPGLSHSVEVDTEALVATIRRVQVNTAGVLSNLHTFSGVSMTDPTRVRDWTLTRIWSFAMDALAVGLIVMVGSGVYLWYQLPGKRIGGLISLLGGILTCGVFLFGLVRLM